MKHIKYKQAKILLKELAFETKKRYLQEAEKYDLPLNPKEIYRDEWEGWEIYLTSLYSYGKPKELSDDTKLFNDLISRPLVHQRS